MDPSMFDLAIEEILQELRDTRSHWSIAEIKPSPPEIEYFPWMENDDGSMDEDLNNLENPDTVPAFVNRVVRWQYDCRRKINELRVTAPLELRFLGPLIEMGYTKIDKITPRGIVLREDKSRGEDSSHQKTNLTSAIDLHKVVSDVTLMPKNQQLTLQQLQFRTYPNTNRFSRKIIRENIASSSNPCNLICNQTPGGATLPVVQSPSETACASNWKPIAAGSGDARVEQGPEFQLSSWVFPSVPAGKEAAGLQGFAAGPEIPVLTKSRPHPAKRPSKTRRVNFEDEEYFQDPANEGRPRKWLEHVTAQMNKTESVGCRESVSLRGLWENLKKGRDAMRRAFPERIADYWKLTEVEKKGLKKIDKLFPLTFEREWYAAMENIEKLNPARAAAKESRRDGQEGAFIQSVPVPKFTEPGSANFAGADYLEETGDEPDSESDIPTDEEKSSGESGASVESHTEIASADSHDPRSEPSRKRSASAFDEDSLFAKIRPFVNQQLEEALLPLISALRSREEDEHKHRQKMLALEREKLDLMRQKLECTRRSNAVPASVAK